MYLSVSFLNETDDSSSLCRKRIVMKRTAILAGFASVTIFLSVSCEKNVREAPDDGAQVAADLEDVAQILSAIPMGTEQMSEVFSAVTASSANGYDEEYTMRDLFREPGSGVGDSETKAPVRSYTKPLRELISDYVKTLTKSDGINPDEYIQKLMSSDIQIYWPFSETWNGKDIPIITFDPGDGSEANYGYKLDTDGPVEKIVVNESLARTVPVWVVNRNFDSEYCSLELLRKRDPQWGQGGTIVITKPQDGKTKADGDSPLQTLILKEFTAKRNFDTWFAGASEFFVKCGSVEDFTASTEAELQLFNPSITDFMIVVRRSQVGQAIPFNAVLVSQWRDQLSSCAFMITEDDGGTNTTWKCSAEVKIKSKTYGFDVSIPYRTKDDIVWRGQLSAKYLEKYSGTVGHFGDVDLKFELME